MARRAAFAALLGLAFAAAPSGGAALEAKPLPTRDRVAIVVGNRDYAAVPDLVNAGKDAADMAALLRGFGFTVFDGYDLDRKGFEDLLRAAMLNLPDGADVVFFYAGHGIQIGRRNYLLPVDVAFQDIYDLPVYSITLDRVVEALSAREATHLAIIDACRENPFPDLRLAADLDATLFETQSGFDVLRTPLNSLVAFSTSPGAIAFDGESGGNSPYTEALLRVVKGDPDADAMQLFSAVRERVYTETAGRQVPWESSTLVRPFQFVEAAATAPAQAGDAPPARATPAQAPRSSAPEPQALALTLALDRRVDLTGALAEGLGGALNDPVLAEPPAAGSLTVSEAGDALFYRPEFAERRATGMTGFTHRDAFALETGPAEARRRVTVTLTLEADACDLHAGDALDLQGVGLYRLPNEIELRPALEACAAAVAAAPEVPRFRYQLGRAQQADGALEAAFDSFAAARAAGHVRALNAEAFLLLTDKLNREVVRIPQDRARGIELLEQGVAARDAFAIHARGARLLREGETPEARQRGFDLLDRAVELGHTYSMNALGIHFLRPGTEAYTPARGMAYLRASAARDDIYGWHNLGFVALNGLDGTAPDLAAAYAWFERAAEGGHPESPSALGRMIMRGQAGAVDEALAVRWYDTGLERGDGWGGANAAAIILGGSVPGLGPADAALRAAKAMLLTDAEAARDAGASLDNIGRRDIDRATQMLLVELREPLAVDGQIGPASRAALGRVLAQAGLEARGGDARARLLDAARAYWALRPTRPDVF
jgi:TPR repeat protein